MEEIIKQEFFKITGKKAKFVSQISFTTWMIETEDGETYKMCCQ